MKSNFIILTFIVFHIRNKNELLSFSIKKHPGTNMMISILMWAKLKLYLGLGLCLFCPFQFIVSVPVKPSKLEKTQSVSSD